MKVQKKSIFFILSLIFCLILFPSHTAAAKSDEYVSCYIDGYKYYTGQTYQLTARQSNLENSTPADFTYKSSDTSIATISKSGVITTKKYGDVTFTATSKQTKKLFDTTTIHIYKGNLKISCNSSSFVAGKTYQLSSNKKNTIWRIYRYDDGPVASVDSKSGKMKVKSAGEAYIWGETKDGQYYGAVTISATGPVIIPQDVHFDPIVLKKDKGIADMILLKESGLLPNKITLQYKNGKKKGKVECKLWWDSWNFHEFTEEGTYEVTPYIMAPDLYTFDDNFHRNSIELKVETAQSDHRIEITKLEKAKITINKDLHIIYPLDIISNYCEPKNMKLVGITKDGKKVNLAACGTSSNPSDIILEKKGTYNEVSLYAEPLAGYVFSQFLAAELSLKIKVPQTGINYEKELSTVDDLAGLSWVSLPVTQDKLIVK